LRSVVRTKETAWYRFLSSDAIYDPDRLTLDRELLRQHYLSDGYADFRVTSAIAELSPNQKDFFVTFGVNEGERYKIGKINIDAKLRDLEANDITEVLKVEPGEWYDIRDVDKSIDEIVARVGELGYAFVDVRPRVKRDRKTRKLNITFQVKEGPRVFVERIDISGNVRTLDKVVRREFQLVEGDAFNTAKLRRSRNRLRRLDFFEKVTVDKVAGSAPDKTVIKVEVEEKSTGSISLGAGYSSSLGPIGEISLAERNFLGRGQNLGVTFSLAAARSEIDFTYTEPYFLNRDVSAGLDVFHVRQDLQALSSIDTNRTGFRLRTGYRVTSDLNQRWAYLIKRASVTNVDSGAAQLVKDQEGKSFISQISHKLVYDTRDSKLEPTEGYTASFLTDLAGLGGSVRHLRNSIRAGLHHPINEDLIFSVGSRVGYIVGLGEDVKFLERYFVGDTEVRGFESSGFGPRDSLTNDALGAEWMYSTKFQLSFPLGLPEDLGIKGRVFTDLGSAGQLSPSNSDVQDDASLRMSAGFGMTWRSPMGPLGMDAGFPILKESYDKEELFQINFGARF
jgi:outer membrane protein insertion porin family